mgnify:CR=1 FL=1
MTAIEGSRNPDLEFLLGEVAAAIQITPTQHKKASGHYHAVAKWLSDEGSPFAHLAIEIYPQGSMALETTVKPLDDRDFDLDFVCRISTTGWSADHLYAAVYNRLRDNDIYRPMLSMKKRCICLSYQGDFHVDIIPAVPNPNGVDADDTNILIPDRQISDWTHSNPKGFVTWFKKKSEVLTLKRAQADAQIHPLPKLTAVAAKPPLAVAIQLAKRMRDRMFGSHDDAPRSILLTTLAGHAYGGSESVLTAMHDIAKGVDTFATSDDHTLRNPTNPQELFSDGLTSSRIEKLQTLASELRSAVIRLSSTRGAPALQEELAKLFGERPAVIAVTKYGELLAERRENHTLTFGPTGLGVVTPAGASRVKPHSYYGG